MVATTYLIKLFARNSIPNSLDYIVKDIVQAGVENRGNIHYYTHILDNLIEFKYQQLEGGMNANTIIKTIRTNLEAYNVYVLKYEIRNLEDDSLTDSGEIKESKGDSYSVPIIAGAIAVIGGILLVIVYEI